MNRLEEILKSIEQLCLEIAKYSPKPMATPLEQLKEHEQYYVKFKELHTLRDEMITLNQQLQSPYDLTVLLDKFEQMEQQYQKSLQVLKEKANMLKPEEKKNNQEANAIDFDLEEISKTKVKKNINNVFIEANNIEEAMKRNNEEIDRIKAEIDRLQDEALAQAHKQDLAEQKEVEKLTLKINGEKISFLVVKEKRESLIDLASQLHYRQKFKKFIEKRFETFYDLSTFKIKDQEQLPQLLTHIDNIMRSLVEQNETEKTERVMLKDHTYCVHHKNMFIFDFLERFYDLTDRNLKLNNVEKNLLDTITEKEALKDQNGIVKDTVKYAELFLKENKLRIQKLELQKPKLSNIEIKRQIEELEAKIDNIKTNQIEVNKQFTFFNDNEMQKINVDQNTYREMLDVIADDIDVLNVQNRTSEQEEIIKNFLAIYKKFDDKKIVDEKGNTFLIEDDKIDSFHFYRSEIERLKALMPNFEINSSKDDSQIAEEKSLKELAEIKREIKADSVTIPFLTNNGEGMSYQVCSEMYQQLLVKFENWVLMDPNRDEQIDDQLYNFLNKLIENDEYSFVPFDNDSYYVTAEKADEYYDIKDQESDYQKEINQENNKLIKPKYEQSEHELREPKYDQLDNEYYRDMFKNIINHSKRGIFTVEYEGNEYKVDYKTHQTIQKIIANKAKIEKAYDNILTNLNSQGNYEFEYLGKMNNINESDSFQMNDLKEEKEMLEYDSEKRYMSFINKREIQGKIDEINSEIGQMIRDYHMPLTEGVPIEFGTIRISLEKTKADEFNQLKKELKELKKQKLFGVLFKKKAKNPLSFVEKIKNKFAKINTSLLILGTSAATEIDKSKTAEIAEVKDSNNIKNDTYAMNNDYSLNTCFEDILKAYEQNRDDQSVDEVSLQEETRGR